MVQWDRRCLCSARMKFRYLATPFFGRPKKKERKKKKEWSHLQKIKGFNMSGSEGLRKSPKGRNIEDWIG